MSRRPRVDGVRLGGEDFTHKGSFIHKPSQGWLHPDKKIAGPGVSYIVRGNLLPPSPSVPHRGSDRPWTLCRTPLVSSTLLLVVVTGTGQSIALESEVELEFLSRLLLWGFPESPRVALMATPVRAENRIQADSQDLRPTGCRDLRPGKRTVGEGLSRSLLIALYMGCIEVLKSMRSLDFNTRTQVTREAINRLYEAVPGVKGAWKKKAMNKTLQCIMGKSNLRFAGMSIAVNISIEGLSLRMPATRQVIAHHPMQSISFASGGDTDTPDYVAYVAKDPVNQRACHILECCDGLAQSVISTIGQAFELQFKQYLHSPPKAITTAERISVLCPALSGQLEQEEPGLPSFGDQQQPLTYTGWNIGTEESAWGDDEDSSEHDYYNSIPGKEPPLGGVVDSRLRPPGAMLGHIHSQPHSSSKSAQMGLSARREGALHTPGQLCYEVHWDTESSNSSETASEPVCAQWPLEGSRSQAGCKHTRTEQQKVHVCTTNGSSGLTSDGYLRADGQPPGCHDYEEHLYVNTHSLEGWEEGSEGTRGAPESPKKDLFDMTIHKGIKAVCYPHLHRPFEDALKLHETGGGASALGGGPPLLGDQWPSPPRRRAPIAPTEEQLRGEPWYHGRVSRRDAEKLLAMDGDFLVRDSVTNPGQYVLTGMHSGLPKHLLLVDPEGVVRTKDMLFESISHLINYHLQNELPIVAAERLTSDGYLRADGQPPGCHDYEEHLYVNTHSLEGWEEGSEGTRGAPESPKKDLFDMTIIPAAPHCGEPRELPTRTAIPGAGAEFTEIKCFPLLWSKREQSSAAKSRLVKSSNTGAPTGSLHLALPSSRIFDPARARSPAGTQPQRVASTSLTLTHRRARHASRIDRSLMHRGSVWRYTLERRALSIKAELGIRGRVRS
ncbi:SHC3 protein, partial [Atractosteus spatula]|nr:SHC3 protein [Atractosteus spatula]